MNRRFMLFLVLILCALIPSLVWAHAGHSHAVELSIWSGFVHPVTGIDHLIAALAVGAWAVFSERSRWQIPALFLGTMSVGAVGAWAGVTIGGIALLSSISVVALGGLLATATLWRRGASLMVVAAIGLIHGGAHMAGVAATGSTLSLYLAAMVISTALLHGCGFFVARRFLDSTSSSARLAPKWAGAAVAMAGLLILSTQLLL